MKDIITLRGERDLWLDFIHKAKKEKKKAWDVLNPSLKKYVSADQETQVLLILFPKALVEQLLTKDDPDGFIEEAIKRNLLKDRDFPPPSLLTETESPTELLSIDLRKPILCHCQHIRPEQNLLLCSFTVLRDTVFYN